MSRVLAALFAGALFGIGLALARMTDPTVVLGFLDVAGAWDPTLAIVMAGAVATTWAGYRLVLRRAHPLFADDFQLPTSRVVDAPLVVGAVLFGVGWGVAGYCPGPVLVALARGVDTALWFVPAMLAGSLLQRLTASARRGA